ncbi:MAG: Hpt domain-containing protein, partial [Pseudobdellovibrionaceae bacterium]
EDLRSNIAKENFVLVRKRAHALKSSSSNLGLSYLATMLEKIEKEEIHDSELINYVEKIDVEFKIASKELEKYLG